MRRKRVFLPAVVLAALGILAVSVAPVVYAGGGRESQIREVVAAFEEAYKDMDVERVMAFYTEDAVSMPPGWPASVGKDAIRADFEYFFETFTVEHRDFEIVDIWISGNLATRHGEWSQTLSLNKGNRSFTEYGKCVVGFMLVGDEWKVIWEIWNNH
jgi:uncharacterized protein (TIGR02246 family)